MKKGTGKMETNNEYLGGCYPAGDSNTIMIDVWGWLMVEYEINSVLDVGCGYGHAIKWFEEFPINCVGVDGYVPAVQNKICRNNLHLHDYTSGNFNTSFNFDLGWSSEFLEHIEEKYIVYVFDSFLKCKHVCITHAYPEQIGFHHVNCQTDEYWIGKFKDHNFCFDATNSQKLRKTDRWNAPWGRKSLMLFHNENI
jgi:SAM-dependent methyltransferase